MLQVKADNMAIFIHREREDIASLWDALYYSDEERGRFALMEAGGFPLLPPGFTLIILMNTPHARNLQRRGLAGT